MILKSTAKTVCIHCIASW